MTDRTKWRLRESGREITLAWAGGEFIPSEHMSLKVRTASGTCRAPIWIPEPDWSTRDGETGIPIDPDERSSIDPSSVGRGRSWDSGGRFVTPSKKRK